MMRRGKMFFLLLACNLMGTNGLTALAAQQEPETPYISRIVSFTDYTGMRVTYDANVSQQYVYEVENGVLKAVRMKGEDQVSGNSADTSVSFTGNVELKQPEEGEKYTSIGADIFQGNREITYVRLPAGITGIAAESFKDCVNLQGIYLPSTVNKIEDSAFENCAAMTQISLPKALVSIGDSAFRGDEKLHLVHVRDVESCGLKAIGARAFEGCAALEYFCSDSEFVLPPKLEEIGEAAFQGCKAAPKIDFSDTE